MRYPLFVAAALALSASCTTSPSSGIARSRALYAAERTRDLSPHTVFEYLDPLVHSVDTVTSTAFDGPVAMYYYSSGVPPARCLVAYSFAEPLPGGRAAIMFEGYYQPCTRPGCNLPDLEQDSLWMKMFYEARPEDSVWMKVCVTEIFASIRAASLNPPAPGPDPGFRL